MPSNFTARVLQAIEREATTTDRAATKPSAPWWRGLFPRIAVAAVVVGGSVLAYRHHQTVQREELADAAKNSGDRCQCHAPAGPDRARRF